MASTRLFSCLVRAALVPLLSCACLPTDTRDLPGELIVSASPEGASTRGFTTDDGWSITYTRFLVVIGGVFILNDNDFCDPYSQGDYNRILDMADAAPQKVSWVYGLGACRFSFRIVPPRWNTIRGAGVSEADETFLRTAGSDGHADGLGISVYLEGSAVGPAGRKDFTWSFRPVIDYEDCFVPPDSRPEAGVTLRSDQTAPIDLRIRGTALFQQAPAEPVGPLLFEPFREADDLYGNADGTITLDELDDSPLPPGASQSPEIQTLGDHVYLELLPGIARFQGNGSCRARVLTQGVDFGF